MKYLYIIAIIFLNFYAMAEDNQSVENANQRDDAIIKLLNDNSTISERLGGFGEAERIDSEKINLRLVQLLDSKQKGGKYYDMLLGPSWQVALIILAKRFPEANITKRPITYQQSDSEVFKRWWVKNSARIQYHDNTHTLVPVPQPTQTPPTKSQSTPEVKKEATPQATPIIALPNPIPAPTPAVKSTPTPQPAISPTPTTTPEIKSARKFPIAVIVIIAAGIVSIVIILLRRKSP